MVPIDLCCSVFFEVPNFFDEFFDEFFWHFFNDFFDNFFKIRSEALHPPSAGKMNCNIQWSCLFIIYNNNCKPVCGIWEVKIRLSKDNIPLSRGLFIQFSLFRMTKKKIWSLTSSIGWKNELQLSVTMFFYEYIIIIANLFGVYGKSKLDLVKIMSHSLEDYLIQKSI